MSMNDIIKFINYFNVNFHNGRGFFFHVELCSFITCPPFHYIHVCMTNDPLSVTSGICCQMSAIYLGHSQASLN